MSGILVNLAKGQLSLGFGNEEEEDFFQISGDHQHNRIPQF
jgi:hypothetical protein